MSALPRTLRIVLLLSLALNVALGVFVAWHHGPWRDGDRGRHAPGLPHLFDVRALRRVVPPEREDVIRPIFEQHRPEMRRRLHELFAARGDVRRAIAAEPYDRAQLESAFARLREADRATAEQAQLMLAELLAVATPEERRKMSELMARGGSRARAWRERHARQAEARDAEARDAGARDAGARTAGPGDAEPRDAAPRRGDERNAQGDR